MENKIIQDKYIFLDKIGKGSFGQVYKGMIMKTNKIIAIKTEAVETNHGISPLKNETVVLNYLNREKCKNIPLVYWYGLYEKIKCLVISYYQTSLKNIFSNIKEKQKQNIEKKEILINVFFLFKCLLNIIQYIHEKKVIHRDIKPDNFMYHDGEFYLIDFGIATFVSDDLESKTVKDMIKEDGCIIGTPNYISIFVHQGKSPEPIDDLISLGYIFYYFECFLLNRNIELYSNNNKMEMKIEHIKSSKDEISDLSDMTTKIHLYLKKCYYFSLEEKRIQYLILKEIFNT